MNRRRIILTAMASALAAVSVTACGDRQSTDAAAAAPAPAKTSPREAYELAAQASGFTVGPMMAANTVYVFFDATCPHCAALWASSKPLLSKLKMVWIPIGLLQRSSAPQGATILSAPDPTAAMAENEASVLERKGGITVSRSLGDDVLAKVKANTDLFTKLGADSVPFIVYKNAKTGEYGSVTGSVDTGQLAAMAGLS